MNAIELRRALLVVAASVACIASCAKLGRDETFASDVPAKYRAIFEGFVEQGDVERVWAGFPYDSIRVDRSSVWPGAPDGELVLHRGGRAEFRGSIDGTYGSFEGDVDLFDFGKLCYAFEQSGFERLLDRYSDEGFDAGESTFEVTSKSGSKRVVDHGDVGPIELWTLGAALDGVRARIRWTPVKK
jgi:hypothetical protein